MQGLLLELQQQQQLQSNTTNGMVAGITGATSYGGVSRNIGNNVPMVNSTAVGMIGSNDADWTNSEGLSFRSFPAVVTAQQQQQQQQKLQEQRQSQMIINQMSTMMYQHNHDNYNDRSAKRGHHTHPTNINGAGGVEASSNMASTNADILSISVARHLPLLHPSSADGALLRSYYELSTNDVLNLPPIPTDEEYLARLSLDVQRFHQPNKFPTYDQSALRAARFSELALGALANGQVSLSMELSNASVICLRDCVDKPAHTSCLYDVSRTYLLLGIFRSFRGDMTRYFKYRRVCMMHILKLDVSILHTE